MTNAETPERRRRRGPSVAAVGGLIALVTAAIGLAFTLWPSLTPDPGTSISADLRVVTIEPHARYRDWLNRLPASQRVTSAGTIPTEALNARGYIVYLQVQVDGRKRHEIAMTQSIYSANNHFQLVPAENVLGFTSDTPSDRWIATAFVHDPGFGKAIFGRYELVDRGTILALADTGALRFPT